MADASGVNIKDDLTIKFDRTSILKEDLHACSSCGGDAKLWCQVCFRDESDTQNQHQPTWYCDKECQSKSWSTHKAYCREISNVNQLYRGAHLVQAAFYNLRKHGYDMLIDNYTIEGSKMQVQQGQPGNRVLFTFPEHLIKDRTEEEALLSFGACQEAIECMAHMFSLAFDGIYKTIEEIWVKVTNVKREMFLHIGPGYVQNPEGSHEILRVVLKSGKAYAVDIAGAQFGFHEPVMPWEASASQRVEAITEKAKSFGTQKLELANLLGYAGVELKAVTGNAKTIGDEQDRALNQWLEFKNTTIKAILKQKRDDKVSMTEELLKMLSDEVLQFVTLGIKSDALTVAYETRHDDGIHVESLIKGDGSERKITILH